MSLLSLINKSYHITFEITMKFIDLVVKTNLCKV